MTPTPDDRGCPVCAAPEARWLVATAGSATAPLGQRFRVLEADPGARWWCRRHAEEVEQVLNTWEAEQARRLPLSLFADVLTRYGKH